MLSFQGGYELCQSLSSDDDSDNLTLLKKLYNIGLHKLEKKLGIYYTEKTRDFTTVTDAISGTSYQAYPLPQDYNTFTELYVTISSTQYYADLIQDIRRWRRMNSTTASSTSNHLSHCFVRRDRIELYPIPASAQSATLRYTTFSKDLSAADYVTGSITTLANEGTAVTGDGTTFTAGMVGRYFKIDDDGDWYRISAYTDATHITLETPYQGTAISGGSEDYTIGEMPNTPPDTHELPCWYALWKYNQFRKRRDLARDLKSDWLQGIKEAVADWNNRNTSQVFPDTHRTGRRLINPNYYPQDMS